VDEALSLHEKGKGQKRGKGKGAMGRQRGTACRARGGAAELLVLL